MTDSSELDGNDLRKGQSSTHSLYYCVWEIATSFNDNSPRLRLPG